MDNLNENFIGKNKKIIEYQPAENSNILGLKSIHGLKKRVNNTKMGSGRCDISAGPAASVLPAHLHVAIRDSEIVATTSWVASSLSLHVGAQFHPFIRCIFINICQL